MSCVSRLRQLYHLPFPPLCRSTHLHHHKGKGIFRYVNANLKREKNSVIFNLITKQNGYTDVSMIMCEFSFLRLLFHVSAPNDIDMTNVSNFQQKNIFGMHYMMLMQWFQFVMEIIRPEEHEMMMRREREREGEGEKSNSMTKSHIAWKRTMQKPQTFFCWVSKLIKLIKLGNLFFLFHLLIGWADPCPRCSPCCPYHELLLASICCCCFALMPSTKAHKLLYRNEMTMNNKKTQLDSTTQREKKNEIWKIWRMPNSSAETK